jgi:hypothetical protein
MTAPAKSTSARRQAAGRTPGRIEAMVPPKDHQVSVRITRTTPADPVRNIRFVPATAEAVTSGSPSANIPSPPGAGFRSSASWTGSRPKLRQREWPAGRRSCRRRRAARGVAVEYLVDLANELKADPWFASRTRPATTMSGGSRARETAPGAGRRVYVEYSNECWNGIFGQARYCGDRGRALKLSDNAYQAQLRYYAQRSVEVFAIFERVFGGNDRSVRVLASHTQPWASEQVLTWKCAPPRDALGVAPYFGHEFGHPDKVESTLALGVEGLLEACKPTIEKNRAVTTKQAEMARRFGLSLVAYEGGPHMVGIRGAENNEKLTALFTAANRHPAVQAIYLQDLSNWRDAGGGLFVAFASTARPSKWGNWGLLEHDSQDPATAPKYQAVRQFMQRN